LQKEEEDSGVSEMEDKIKLNNKNSRNRVDKKNMNRASRTCRATLKKKSNTSLKS
jgi:hypothetical protein